MLQDLNETKKLEKVLIIYNNDSSRIEKLLMDNNFRIVKSNPDFVVCYGGDGTILFSERKFPQVPKLIVKRLSICRKCDYTLNDVEKILLKIRDGKYRIRKEMKLETKIQK